jgi:DNA-binding transcriptional ArsR family regulator
MDLKTFTALAEPNRLRIIELLREQPCSVNDVAARLDLRQPQASKHLRTLSEAGLISARPYAQQRIYTLNPEPFLRLSDWTNSFTHYWETRFSMLDDYLDTLKER